MPITYLEAVDEICSLIKAVWDGNSAGVVGYVPTIYWPGQPQPKPDMSKFWARVSTQIVVSSQSSLSADNGTKKYETNGLVFFQLFCPRAGDINALLHGRELSQLILAAYRHPLADNVWFRNMAGPIELPSTDEYYPMNVKSEFTFQEIS